MAVQVPGSTGPPSTTQAINGASSGSGQGFVPPSNTGPGKSGFTGVPAELNQTNPQFTRDEPYANPVMQARPMDPIWSGKLFRGWIMETPFSMLSGFDGNGNPISTGTQAKLFPSQLYRLNFLYNPSTVEQGWDIDLSAVPPSANITGTTPGAINLKGITFGINLFFDRRRAVDRVGAPDGVLSDVRILTKIMSSGQGGPGTRMNAGTYSPVWLALGRSIDPSMHGTTQPLTNPLGAIGYITYANVQYTMFDSNMTPIQCSMSLTIRTDYFLPNTSQVNDSIGTPTTRPQTGPLAGAFPNPPSGNLVDSGGKLLGQ